MGQYYFSVFHFKTQSFTNSASLYTTTLCLYLVICCDTNGTTIHWGQHLNRGIYVWKRWVYCRLRISCFTGRRWEHLLSTQDEVILFFKRCLISVQRLTFHFFFLLSWLTLLKHNIFDYELDKCLFVQPVRLRNHNHHTFPLTKSWIRPVWEQWSMRTQTYLNNEKEKWPDGPTVFCHVPDNSRSGFLC